MPRRLREDWEGAWHHVMNRGARRAPIFETDEHCDIFLTCVGEIAKRFGVEVHAYALMPNHYHLLVRSVRGNLSDAMRHLGGSYTRWINSLREWDGPMFKGRFRNQLIADAEDLRTVLAYIHLNPVRAKLVLRADELNTWTSHRAYLGLDLPPEWLSRDLLLADLGGAAGVGDFVQQVWSGTCPWPEHFNLESGWFRAHEEREAPWSVARSVRDGAPAPVVEPDRIFEHIERITGFTCPQLRIVRRGAGANPERRFAAWALDRYTGLKQRQIGKLLDMSESQTSRMLVRLRRHLPAPLEAWSDPLAAAIDGELSDK